MYEKRELEGNVYGYLKVVERDRNITDKHIYYKCICTKCNSQLSVRKDVLPKQRMCLHCANKSRLGTTHPAKDKTMIKKIGAITKSNKSGVVGVNWDKSRQKWQASIRYKGKKYFLGRFKDINKAIEVRKKAEDEIRNREQKQA